MNNFKIIAPSINKMSDRKIVWNYTKKDIFFSIISLLIFAIIWIPLIITNNLIPAIIVIAITMLITSMLNIKFNLNTRIYQILFLWFKFLSKNKKINIKIIKEINNNEITFVNNSQIKIFRIIGKDTSFISDHEFESISQGLKDFFNESHFIQIVKIDSQIDLDNQFKLLNKFKLKESKNNDEISQIEKFILKLKEEQQTSTQSKYFLIIQLDKNINNIEINFSKAKILLKEASDNETNEIAKKFFLNNDKYIENIRNLYNENRKEFISFCSIKKLPIKAYKQWLSFILNYQDIDISFGIKDWDKEKALKKIDNILLLNFEKLQTQNDSKLIQTQLIEETFSETLKAIEVNQDSLKNISIIIKFVSSNKKDLNYKIKKFCKDAMKNNYEIDRLWFLQEIGLKRFISFNNIQNENNLIGVDCLSSVLGWGYPFIQQELIDNNGLIVGIDENETPVSIDWKYRSNNKPSSSTILLGQTGSGKTTTTKRIIKNQIISSEYKIFIIDPENEYGYLIENLGGQKINLLNKNFLINPFALNSSNRNLEEQINSKISFLTTFFQLIFNNLLLQNDILNLISACFDLYQKNKFNEWTFTDLKKHITKLKFKETTINVMNQYCDGKAFGNLFDHKTKLNFNNDYVCFEFKEIISKSSSEIAKAQIFLVLQFLNEQILNTNKEKYLNVVLDEAHLLLDEKYIEIAQYLCEMFKRIRKYNGMMLIATQNISDFYTKKAILPYTLPIINNSFYIIIHSIKPQEIEDLNLLMKEVGGINEQERKFLIDASCGNAILFFKNVRTKIKVNP